MRFFIFLMLLLIAYQLSRIADRLEMPVRIEQVIR
jgi:hypothetical protein